MFEIPLPHVRSIDRNIERDDIQYETNDLDKEVRLIRSIEKRILNNRCSF